MQKFSLMCLVGCGGFIGASLRYLISIQSAKVFGSGFPYGTLLVNILGAFLIGMLMELSLTSTLIAPNVRLFLTTGIMGGLTTFSTFSFETIELFLSGRTMSGILNVTLNLILCLVCVALGQSIIRFI